MTDTRKVVVAEWPTAQQRKVVQFSGQRLLVVAGPGTGKTRTIVERMIRLLSEDAQRVVSFLTFTRASRRDTERNVRRAVDERAVDIQVADLPRVSTLHTFAKSLVHRLASTIGRDDDFSVLVTDKGERQLLVSEVIEDLSLEAVPDLLERAIVQFRATRQWPEEPRLTSAQCIQVIDAFDHLLAFYNTFDMEGIVLAACRILSEMGRDSPPVWLQVDEYQDLNPVDQELVQLAASNEASQVVVVGDDAQSIYGFRHANPSGLRELWASGQWEALSFSHCHRLPAHVLRAAHSLIKDRGYLGAQMEVPPDDGRRILTLQCTRHTLQAEAIAVRLKELKANNTKSDGSPLRYQDFLVLCPNNAQVTQMASALQETYGIPTRQPGAQGMEESVWRLLLILRMLGHADSLAFRQWLDVVGVAPAFTQHLRRAAMLAGESLLDHCSLLDNPQINTVYVALSRLRDAQLNPKDFQSALEEFPGLRLDEHVERTIGEILQYLPFTSTMIGHVYGKHGLLELEPRPPDGAEEDGVLVTTLHSAKGLEAEFVFISWLNAAFMPASGRDPEEEERVLYVALTRARQDVVLTCFEEYDRRRRRPLRREAVSPFLLSIERHLDILRVRRTRA